MSNQISLKHMIYDPETETLSYKRGGVYVYTTVYTDDDYPIYNAAHRLQVRIRRRRESNRLVDHQHKVFRRRKHQISYHLVGGVRDSGGFFLRQLRNYKRNTINAEKKPFNGRHHVGIEIEFISSQSQEAIEFDLMEANLEQYVNLTTDGSVHGDGRDDCDGSCRESCECMFCGERHYCESESECIRLTREYGGTSRWEYRAECDDCRDSGNVETIDDCDCGGTNGQGERVCYGDHVVCIGHCRGHSCPGDHEFDCTCECTCSSEPGHELRVIAGSKQYREIIERVCKVLVEDNGATVNSTCGLHVHLDMRNRDVNKAYHNLFTCQDLLYSMVPAARRRSSYCRPNTERKFSDADATRYLGINCQAYNEHKTLEVRLHSGTVNAEKISNWVELLQAIVDCPVMLTKSHLISWNKFQRALNLRPDLIKYIQKRIEKFASEHGSKGIAFKMKNESAIQAA